MNNEELERIIRNAILESNSIKSQYSTLSTWLLSYKQIILKRGYAISTIKNKVSIIKHIETILGFKNITNIRPFEISDMLSGFSSHNAGRILSELKDIYFEAIANGVTNTNPVLHVRSPKQLRIRKRLTLDVYNQMLEKAFDSSITWLAPMLLLALSTGQRRGDLVKMRFEDIVDGYLRVEQEKKANKTFGARLAIPLNIYSKALGCTLSDIVELCKINSIGPTLLRKSNGTSIEVSSLSARFHELIIQVLGVDAYAKYEWPSLHEIRSLSARTYLSEGIHPSVIQTLLGHKHEEMTEIYLDDRGLTEKEYKLVKY